MNLKRRAYILSSNEMARPQLLWWLEDHGFNRHSDIVFIHEARDLCVAMSSAIRKAVEDGVGMAVFCENDAFPCAAGTDKFFTENRYHLQCVKYDTEGQHAFDSYDSFHTLIWRASRESLLSIVEYARANNLRLCEWGCDSFGTAISACACDSISKIAKSCGLTTGWVGKALHSPKQKSLVPRICVYGA